MRAYAVKVSLTYEVDFRVDLFLPLHGQWVLYFHLLLCFLPRGIEAQQLALNPSQEVVSLGVCCNLSNAG